MSELRERRKFASHQSQGSSAQFLYDKVSGLLTGLPHHADLLDFGAGRGTLIRHLLSQKKPMNLTGVDIMARPDGLPSEVTWVQIDLNEELPDSLGPFDAILAVEVIEHLENPRAVVRSWRRVLKPRGRLIFSTPNNESLRSLLSLMTRGHYVDFGERSYPAHITALLQTDLKRILIEEGFQDIQWIYTNHGLLPKFTRWTWQGLSLGILRGKRFSDNLIVSATRGR